MGESGVSGLPDCTAISSLSLPSSHREVTEPHSSPRTPSLKIKQDEKKETSSIALTIADHEIDLRSRDLTRWGGRKRAAAPRLPFRSRLCRWMGPRQCPPRAGAGLRQPVILKQPTRLRCAEVAGGTAVCCCFPCTLVDLIVLASVRLPVALCRRVREAPAKRKEGACKQKEAKLLRAKAGGEGNAQGSPAATGEDVLTAAGGKNQGSSEAEVTEMEKEMQAQFHNTGFWRSPSQRNSH